MLAKTFTLISSGIKSGFLPSLVACAAFAVAPKKLQLLNTHLLFLAALAQRYHNMPVTCGYRHVLDLASISA